MFYINNSSKCAFLGDVFFWQSEDHRSVHAAECESKRVAAPSRPRRGHSLETSRGASAATTWTFRGDDVAAPPRPRRGHSLETGRGGAAAATWTFLGDESRRRRGRDVDIPWRRITYCRYLTQEEAAHAYNDAVSSAGLASRRKFNKVDSAGRLIEKPKKKKLAPVPPSRRSRYYGAARRGGGLRSTARSAPQRSASIDRVPGAASAVQKRRRGRSVDANPSQASITSAPPETTRRSTEMLAASDTLSAPLRFKRTRRSRTTRPFDDSASCRAGK